jgi:hypothetical protein
MLRIKWLVVAAIAASAVLVSTAAAAAAGRDAFAGHWVGVEVPIGDGSTDYMSISGADADGVRHWQYYETNASGICSPGGGGAFSASGTGSVVGDTLTVTVTFTECWNGLPGAFGPPFDISMSTTGDGHVDWSGVIFSRAGAG